MSKRQKKLSFFSFKNILINILVIMLIVVSYLAYSNYSVTSSLKSQINNLNSQISDLNNNVESLNLQIKSKDSTISTQKSEISSLKYDIELKKKEIQKLQNRVNDLEEELGITKTQLQETTVLYEEAKPYQERVNRGQNLAQSYTLLSDYEDYTKSIVLNYLGLSAPTIPSNDNELWERGRKIYNWLSDNYVYCGDKGLRVGTTFYEFQFYSPDELLMSDNARCGDCDDFSTLWSGMMYASGVPKSKLWVVCGTVGSGGHCWNWLSLSDQTYRIDPVCSQKQDLFSFLGLSWGTKGAYYTSTKENVDCFSSYDAQMRMNPDNFYSLS